MTPAPEAVLRSLYAAVASKDPATIGRCLDPNVTFHVPGRGPNTGDYVGIPAVLAMLGRAGEHSSGTLRFELTDVAVGRDHVLALARFTATRMGRDGATKELDNRVCHVVRLNEGRVMESWFHSRDQYAVDAFWND